MARGTVRFPDYYFPVRDLGPWPDDIFETKMFAAYVVTTVSGKAAGNLET
jgi:hypothetical protein